MPAAPLQHFTDDIARARAIVAHADSLPHATAAFPGGELAEGWQRLLRFLAPITIPGALEIEVSS